MGENGDVEPLSEGGGGDACRVGVASSVGGIETESNACACVEEEELCVVEMCCSDVERCRSAWVSCLP